MGKNSTSFENFLTDDMSVLTELLKVVRGLSPVSSAQTLVLATDDIDAEFDQE